MSPHSDWITVKFGDIAVQATERIDRPEDSDLNYYIGLEHIDSENLKISNYGNASDVVSSKFVCHKGDIIFGRRRAYLKKLAISDRDALVSTDAMIIRPKEGFSKEFMILVMQTDRFWDEVIARSAGSLSPRIKWRDLRSIDVPMPPSNIQEDISKLVFSVQDNIEKTENLIEVSEKLKNGLLEELLTRGIGHKKFKITELGEIPEEWKLKRFSEIMKINPEALSNKTETNYELEYIDISSVEGPNNIIKTERYKFANAPSRARRIVKKRDVIISTVRPYLKGFALVSEDKENLICSTGFAVLRETDLIVAEYIFQYCLSELFKYQSNMAMVGSNYPSLNNDAVEKLLIPLPPIEEQKRVVSLLTNVDAFLTCLKSNSSALANLKKKLANSLISGEQKISTGDKK